MSKSKCCNAPVKEGNIHDEGEVYRQYHVCTACSYPCYVEPTNQSSEERMIKRILNDFNISRDGLLLLKKEIKDLFNNL